MAKDYEFIGKNRLTEILTNIKNTFIKKTDVDSSMSDTSENPIQNKVISTAVNDLSDDVGTVNEAFEQLIDGGPGSYDSALSTTSSNAIQNQAVANKFNEVDGSIAKINVDLSQHDYSENTSLGGTIKQVKSGNIVNLSFHNIGSSGEFSAPRPYANMYELCSLYSGSSRVGYVEYNTTNNKWVLSISGGRGYGSLTYICQ